MLSFEEVQELLSREADRLPEAVFRGLNGGILLLPDTVLHPQSAGNNLYILGQYRYEPWGLGRYIVLFYGSYRRALGHLPRREQEERLRGVLRHELTHHLEHLAGDRSLELADARELEEYRRRWTD